ncbi:MAG: rRNA pseudouridine synthase [Bacillota bacterium]|nr:rRNA pseudouridine synthase [Bacillota bacterium]
MERLQKYMAECGAASRRKSEEIILSGRVKVNGQVITELGFKIDKDKDTVLLDDKLIKEEENKVYIALNKPTGYLSSVSDDRGRKTIIDLVPVSERIYPIGRLDYDSCGLILLTNDGEIYNKVIHPRKNIDKLYRFIINGRLAPDDIEKLEKGVDIGGYVTRPCKIKIIDEGKDSSYEIIIHEGKNRQIRKMLESAGFKVIYLERMQIGKIYLGKLSRGNYRVLTNNEINYLKSL